MHASTVRTGVFQFCTFLVRSLVKTTLQNGQIWTLVKEVKTWRLNSNSLSISLRVHADLEFFILNFVHNFWKLFLGTIDCFCGQNTASEQQHNLVWF